MILVDLGRGRDRLGGSCFAQVFSALGNVPPDLEDAKDLIAFFESVQSLRKKILAYHDRSDGGLFATVCEMAFAGGCGVDVFAPTNAALFSEELGAVIQVASDDADSVIAAFTSRALVARAIGAPTTDDRITIRGEGDVVRFSDTRSFLRGVWSETTHAIARMRDDAICADQEQAWRIDSSDPGLHAYVPFEPLAPFVNKGAKPRVAILREQGVNGQIEMAAAFDHAGFEAVDVHMSDLLENRVDLRSFRGLAACGGFSYGDVLGAGEGWAKSILFHPPTRDMFKAFFERSDAFTLGVCNGCQMTSALSELVPGGRSWPRFVTNKSERFEARVAMVEILESPSIFLQGMAGARLPIAVAHGEGRAELSEDQASALFEAKLVSARFVDNHGKPTDLYPANPNGSPRGITAVTTPDGRATILMPHPERVFRAIQHSWRPREWEGDGPWMRMFRNARNWVG